MTTTEDDVRREEYYDNLYKEFSDLALEDEQLYSRVVDDFKESRLRDYYVDHPLVAQAAQGALAEAQALRADHPRAALVFAAIAAEVCLKDALLAPILHGSFHTSSSADLVVKFVVANNNEKLMQALLGVLEAHTQINLQKPPRTGSNKSIWEKIQNFKKKRNLIVHRADTASVIEADAAIEVAKAVLHEVFDSAVRNLGLHLHENVRVCALPNCP